MVGQSENLFPDKFFVVRFKIKVHWAMMACMCIFFVQLQPHYYSSGAYVNDVVAAMSWSRKSWMMYWRTQDKPC